VAYVSESPHFVGLAISACLFTSSPRPSCTADLSAALGATAPVRSFEHARPCSAPLQPLLPLPFPAPPLVVFCAHLTFHHSLSCPFSQLPAIFSYYSPLTLLCPVWHICCLYTGFECLPLVWLPFWGYCWNRLILFFPKSPKAFQSDLLCLCIRNSCCIRKLIKSTYRQQNQLSTQVVFA
jgi:hypothetical protein